MCPTITILGILAGTVEVSTQLKNVNNYCELNENWEIVNIISH